MKKLTVPASADQLNLVTEFIEEQLALYNCPMKINMQIQIAVEEIFINIASYAYAPGTGDAEIEIDVQEDPRTVVLTFRDNGVPYDPLKKQDPDTSLSAEERKIGGLGIYIVKKTMDELSYEYQDHMNVLTMKKRI